jgi:hypothetical protein
LIKKPNSYVNLIILAIICTIGLASGAARPLLLFDGQLSLLSGGFLCVSLREFRGFGYAQH